MFEEKGDIEIYERETTELEIWIKKTNQMETGRSG